MPEMEILKIESTGEFEMPAIETQQVMPLDTDGNVVITDVEFPMPKAVTNRYDGTTTDVVDDEDEDDSSSKTVTSSSTKVVSSSSKK
jgi:hypothetical protein